ncbi:MAG: hypothetical protein K8W52_13105 [Deltaproteobacteria bacterium]|nr:hypothetical protein [Deltaproteobacteria bacterium]
MAENQFLSVIRTWAAMAWADGVVVAAEALAMRKLIESAELSAADRATAMGFLETKVELDTAGLSALSPDARKGVYKAACRLAAVDRDLAEPERALLARLRDGLELGAAAAEIEAAVFGAPKV